MMKHVAAVNGTAAGDVSSSRKLVEAYFPLFLCNRGNRDIPANDAIPPADLSEWFNLSSKKGEKAE
jgi:hypothetical protein